MKFEVSGETMKPKFILFQSFIIYNNVLTLNEYFILLKAAINNIIILLLFLNLNKKIQNFLFL